MPDSLGPWKGSRHNPAMHGFAPPAARAGDGGLGVLHVIDSGGLYGAERVLLALAVEQARRGLEPTVGLLRPMHAIAAAAERAGIPCRVLSLGPPWSAGGAIVDAARELGARIVHSHGFKSNILLGALPRPRRRGLAVMTTIHGWTETRALSRMALYGRLDRALLGRLDAVVFVHDGAARAGDVDVTRLRRTAVIANGILAPELRRELLGAPRSGLAASLDELAGGRPLVLAAGRLSPEKGHRDLVEAIGELRASGVDVCCVILGEGPCRAELARRCRELGLGEDSVLMPGFSEMDEELLRRASVFCLPSLRENMPLVLLEALEAGIAVVATRVGGVPALVGERSGRLVPPGDSAALARALRAAIASGVAPATGTTVRFPSAPMAEKYEALYRQIVA